MCECFPKDSVIPLYHLGWPQSVIGTVYSKGVTTELTGMVSKPQGVAHICLKSDTLYVTLYDNITEDFYCTM